MAPTSRNVRTTLAAAAFAGIAILIAAPAFATAPGLTPKVLQCDGSFASGSVTSHPVPTVLVEKQSSSPGLKIGQRRLSVLASGTIALWRFDGNYDVSVSSCYANGCSGGASCITVLWKSTSTNGSADLQLGRCAYNCAGTVRDPEPTDQIPVQIAACPATIAAAGTTLANTTAGPLAGAASLGLSSTALTLNGSTVHGTALDDGSWDLPPSYTLAAWIKTAGTNGYIVSQASVTGHWGIAISTGGTLRHFDSRDSASNAVLPNTAANVINDNAWHLVHVVRRNAVDRRFYVDGRFTASVPASSSSSFASHPNNAPVEVGRSSAGVSFFNGALDDVRVVNVALSDDDIMLEWNTQFHKFSSDSGVTFSTVAGTYTGTPANGTTGAVIYTPPEAYSTTARWRFAGQSIDGESAVTSSYNIGIDNSPPIPPSLTAVATSTSAITWSWGAPVRVCLPPGSASVVYQLVDAAAGGTLTPPGSIAYPTASAGEDIAGAPNGLIGRMLRITDNWGSGLSAATSVYTWAQPPLAVTPVILSTGSARIDWNQNGNPAYTRYLLSLSQDPLFATGVSTPTTLASDFTGSSVTLASLALGTTYYARVQAFSGRSGSVLGGVGSVFVSTAFTTLPSAPVLGALPLSNVSIQWTWTAVPAAQYYNLLDGAGAVLYTGGALSYTQAGLTTNTQYTARVEAVSVSGAGARSSATEFTLANDPTLPVVNAAYSSSITYSWNANINPAYTFYEVSVTTDPAFVLIVATLTVNATAATANGLLPGTTYFARVRSINGSQRLGSFVALASTRTTIDPEITTVLAPPSVYIAPGGSVGQWHFDVGAGTVAADSSGLGNTAFLTCAAAACVSTPTFAAGPSGLGGAASFSGLASGLVRVPDAAQYAFTDDLTVSAWVKPSNLAQPNGAGIVVRGNGGVENFALDVSGSLYRFVAKPGFVAASTNSIAAETWTHLVGVYDSAVGSATLYVNGRPASTVLLVPARTAAAHDISIGNRQSAAAAYDRAFIGDIDAVRIQRRALNAAEALADYQGSFVSTVTPPAPNSAVLIGLGAKGGGAPATLFVSMDPFTHPIAITPAVLSAGLTVIPTGYTLVSNSIVEVVPIVDGVPFTQTLGSSASISMPYADSNGDNIIDNSSPPLGASRIQVYTLNTTVNRWEALPTHIDRASRRVTVFTPHFSVFAMFAPLTVGTSLSQVRVYPIPWRPESRGRFDAAGVTFDRLPVSGAVRILSLAGERVREFSFDGAAAGSVVWNGLTDGGRRAASGVYFARITGEDGSTSLVKFAIER